MTKKLARRGKNIVMPVLNLCETLVVRKSLAVDGAGGRVAANVCAASPTAPAQVLCTANTATVRRLGRLGGRGAATPPPRPL